MVVQAYIPGLGNAFPDLCRKLFDQVMAHDYPAAYITHKRILKLRSLMSVCGPTLVGVTDMPRYEGLTPGYPRAPFARVDEFAHLLKLRKSLIDEGALES